jgi:two-component system NtrC family response regulator
MKSKLLIVDDDEAIRTQMKWALAEEYDVLLAEDRAEALDMFKCECPAVTMLDLGLPPLPNVPDEGLAALSDLLARDRSAKIIIISGQGEKENALRAVGAGAYDFLTKPVDLPELQLLLRRCCYVAALERQYREIERSIRVEVFEEMLGTSQRIQEVFAAIRKVAMARAPVLLLGESGTGKEMAAMAIHRRSSRSNGPFIAINCGSIPENLLESELFGHEKGAFTGAHIQRKGLIESAAGGTLFLDEVGELTPGTQVKLLRFLQDQRFQRVGGREDIQIDTRVVAATNADLTQGIKDGRFREDLYFRLAVVVIHLPPLRERGDDVTVVARAFLERFTASNGKTGLTFAPETLRALTRHSWPGNIRELQNRVQRAVIMADGKRITPADLELPATVEPGSVTPLKEARECLERELVQQALKRHSGNISSTALDLGISRPTLYELMEKLRIAR